MKLKNSDQGFAASSEASFSLRLFGVLKYVRRNFFPSSLLGLARKSMRSVAEIREQIHKVIDDLYVECASGAKKIFRCLI